MRAIVLAAGFGTRLMQVSNGDPKPLIELHGKPLLAHVLECLAAAGICEAVVVGGYHADLIQDQISAFAPTGMSVSVLNNPRPEDGNGSSFIIGAEQVAGEPFLVTMSDHLATPEIIRRLVDDSAGIAVNKLAVDFGAWVPAQVDDATRVLVDDSGRIVRIGKDLETFNGVDTGFFVFRPDVLDLARALFVGPCPFELSDLARNLASSPRGLFAVDVSGIPWLDIDRPRDYEFADQVLRYAANRPQHVSFSPDSGFAMDDVPWIERSGVRGAMASGRDS